MDFIIVIAVTVWIISLTWLLPDDYFECPRGYQGYNCQGEKCKHKGIKPTEKTL